MAFPPGFNTVTIKDARPYFEAKLKKGAIASVAQMTGTPVRTTIATGTATATTLAQYVMALTQDLQARGIIQ